MNAIMSERYVTLSLHYIFFFKRKTAYEMRISDWSSDVCSSDLLESVDKSIARYERVAKSGDKDAKARVEVLQKLRAALDEGRAARTVELDEDERALVRELFLLTLKPVMYVANVLEDGFE